MKQRYSSNHNYSDVCLNISATVNRQKKQHERKMDQSGQWIQIRLQSRIEKGVGGDTDTVTYRTAWLPWQLACRIGTGYPRNHFPVKVADGNRYIEHVHLNSCDWKNIVTSSQ